MKLTLVDVLHTEFKTALRGYRTGQVDSFVNSVREAMEAELAEKERLKQRIQSLEEEVARVREIESTMTNALTLAQQTADEVKANAHRQAENILREAEQARVRMTVEAQTEAEKRRGEIALLQATRDRFETELRAMLSGYSEWLDRRKSSEAEHAEVA